MKRTIAKKIFGIIVGIVIVIITGIFSIAGDYTNAKKGGKEL